MKCRIVYDPMANCGEKFSCMSFAFKEVSRKNGPMAELNILDIMFTSRK